MISCKDINNLASDYLDKRLPLKRRIIFLLHLLICHHCRRFIRQMMVVIDVLQKMPEIKLNDTELSDIYTMLKKHN